MTQVNIKRLLHYGKYSDVFASEDNEGNQYAVKRFYRQELESHKEYVNKNGKLIRKNWLDDFKRGLEIQMTVNHECCIKCIAVNGFDTSGDTEIIGEEIELGMSTIYGDVTCI